MKNDLDTSLERIGVGIDQLKVRAAAKRQEQEDAPGIDLTWPEPCLYVSHCSSGPEPHTHEVCATCGGTGFFRLDVFCSCAVGLARLREEVR